MSHILIAGRPIGEYAKSRFGHLFLVLSDDLTLSSDDAVIRAGPFGNIYWGTLQGQINVTLELTNDSFDDVANTIGVDVTDVLQYYAVGEIQIPGYDVSAIWTTLSDVVSQILANEFTYSFLHENSNSFIGTLLAIIGIEPTGTAGFRYPAVTHVLSQEYFTGANFSYGIRGADVSGETANHTPIGDRLFALNADSPIAHLLQGDHLSTFGGNDELHDGNRRDTLEGGAGDDRYILLDDSAADIIIVGEGNDVIEGGGAQDRIVLRIDLLDQMYADWVATLPEGTILIGDNPLRPSERLGDGAATSGFPILGGFWDMGIEGTEAFRLQTGSSAAGVSDPANPSAASWQTF